MPSATETCSCGAGITVQDQWSTNLAKFLETWRNEHVHRPSARGFDKPIPFPPDVRVRST